MGDFLSASKQFKSAALPWLAEQRESASRVWQASSLPTRKTEDWKYTNLSALAKTDYWASSNSSAEGAIELADATVIAGMNATRLVFVNGQFNEQLSEIHAEAGVDIVRFANADESQQKMIAENLNHSVDFAKHSFAALNTKSMADGVFIKVSANTLSQKPIHIVQLAAPAVHPFSIESRLLVVLERSASATVVEHFFSEEEQENTAPVFTNSMTECVVGDNAELCFYRLMEEAECVSHISGVHSRLARASRLNSFFLTLGTRLSRVDINVNYEGEGAEATINGVYLPRHKQHVDLHTCIEHAVPHCTSNEVFRGIISDEARAVFDGRIHIHRDAQKTEAYLSNKNLLTSDKAEVDTKPELEIYADDVRCAHGATVSQLEESAMHYMKTRGISEKEARVMLSFGFINELLNDLKHIQVSDYCRPKLAARFSRDDMLIRHIL